LWLLETLIACTLDLLRDGHEHPVDDLLQGGWNVARRYHHSIHDGRHREVICDNWLCHVRHVAPSDIRDLEILHGYAIDTPEVIPPLKERRVDSAFCQILPHLIDVHLVVLGEPKRDILCLKIETLNLLIYNLPMYH
jgi:hypothetical protein